MHPQTHLHSLNFGCVNLPAILLPFFFLILVLQSFKVISATCTTDFGHDHNLEASPINQYLYKYNCICRGVAPSQQPVKTEADVNCILYYKECPINPP